MTSTQIVTNQQTTHTDVWGTWLAMELNALNVGPWIVKARTDADGNVYGWQLVHAENGAELSINRQWNDNSRVTVYPHLPHETTQGHYGYYVRDEDKPALKELTSAMDTDGAKRSARRLVNRKGNLSDLFTLVEKAKRHQAERSTATARRDEIAEAIINLYGGHSRSEADGGGATIYPGKVRNYGEPEVYKVEIKADAERADIELHSIPAEHVGTILALVEKMRQA